MSIPALVTATNEEIRAHLQATGWTLAGGWWRSPPHKSGVSVFAILDDRFDQPPGLRDPGIREILRAEAADYGRGFHDPSPTETTTHARP